MSDQSNRMTGANATRQDVASLGHLLGDTPDRAPAWKVALRSLPQVPGGEFFGEKHVEHVAGQVLAKAVDSDPALAQDFVAAFVSAHELESVSDVDDLLGRESFERDNYQGQLAFIREEA